MSDVVRVQAGAVVPIAEEISWRSKLYGGLAIGGAALVAMFAVLAIVGMPANDPEMADGLAGVALFFAIAAALVAWGVALIARGRRAVRAAERALGDPTADWIVVGNELRSTDPRGTGAPAMTLKISSARRAELLRGQPR